MAGPLQIYWWCLIALLAGLLVFLMFVQGGNVLLASRLPLDKKRLILNSTGRKWDLTFTCLVTFGGAFFASFPLFYSTSFSGAYWMWILILLSFVLQAVSYEFQNKKGNLLGSAVFRGFLVANGIIAPLLVGMAVGSFFTGSDFVVDKQAILGAGGAISTWGSDWHGLEAVCSPAILLGLVVLALSMCLGCLYVLNNVDDEKLTGFVRGRLRLVGVLFLLALLVWLVWWMLTPGYAVDKGGTVSMEARKYLHNLLNQWWILAMLLIGALLLLWGLYLGCFGSAKHSSKGRKAPFRKGIWPAGIGTVLVVMAIFFVAGFGGTAYYPSCTELQSSLTIVNSSSSPVTLKAMSYVSILIPFVLAYIIVAWRAMDRKSITADEIGGATEKY